MAVISLAALIDPFDWMPKAHEIWEDCSGDCALAHRYPGFWWHAAANLLYATLAVAVGGGFLAAVRDLRTTRVARFNSDADAAAFTAAHNELVGAGTALAGSPPYRCSSPSSEHPTDDTETDRSDPAVRATHAVHAHERRQRTTRTILALSLLALAAGLPFAAAPLTGGPGATIGGIIAGVLAAGCAVALWPWTWSKAERDHHTNAANWTQARPAAPSETPWDRYAAWAAADGNTVELLLIRRAGSAGTANPSPFTVTVRETFDGEAILEATEAMERLRTEAAELETRARQRHEQALAAAARKPYDDALRALDERAGEEQQRAEADMRRQLEEHEAAERRAQASAVARALRRP
jgi:hypothetical protein